MHRKPLAALAASLAVLAVAGIAFAHGGGPGSIQATSATFDAGTVSGLKSTSCTGADGTYVRTRAWYSGTATSSDARLNGKLRMQANTVYNTSTKLGVVTGSFRVKTATGHTGGFFQAVDNDGSLAGFADGSARHGRARLLANLSATFAPADGFSDGKLGKGSSDDTAVFVAGRCHRGSTGPSGASGATGPTGDVSALAKHRKHRKR
jgi:hypothetical protein